MSLSQATRWHQTRNQYATCSKGKVPNREAMSQRVPCTLLCLYYLCFPSVPCHRVCTLLLAFAFFLSLNTESICFTCLAYGPGFATNKSPQFSQSVLFGIAMSLSQTSEWLQNGWGLGSNSFCLHPGWICTGEASSHFAIWRKNLNVSLDLLQLADGEDLRRPIPHTVSDHEWWH